MTPLPSYLSAEIRHAVFGQPPCARALHELWTGASANLRLATARWALADGPDPVDRVEPQLRRWWADRQEWARFLAGPTLPCTPHHPLLVPDLDGLLALPLADVLNGAASEAERVLLRDFWPGIAVLPNPADAVRVLVLLDAAANGGCVLEDDVAHDGVAPSHTLPHRLPRCPTDQPRTQATVFFKQWSFSCVKAGDPESTESIALPLCTEDAPVELLCCAVLAPLMCAPTPCCRSRTHLWSTRKGTRTAEDVAALAAPYKILETGRREWLWRAIPWKVWQAFTLSRYQQTLQGPRRQAPATAPARGPPRGGEALPAQRLPAHLANAAARLFAPAALIRAGGLHGTPLPPFEQCPRPALPPALPTCAAPDPAAPATSTAHTPAPRASPASRARLPVEVGVAGAVRRKRRRRGLFFSRLTFPSARIPAPCAAAPRASQQETAEALQAKGREKQEQATSETGVRHK